MNLQHLKALCERALVHRVDLYEDEWRDLELEKFQATFTPDFCLKLLSIIETQGKALESLQGMALGAPDLADKPVYILPIVEETLTAVEKILETP